MTAETGATPAQRADLRAMVSKALGYRVVGADGSYHLQRLKWSQHGHDGVFVEAVTVTSVRPASVAEYEMYEMLCQPQADWAGESDGSDGAR